MYAGDSGDRVVNNNVDLSDPIVPRSTTAFMGVAMEDPRGLEDLARLQQTAPDAH